MPVGTVIRSETFIAALWSWIARGLATPTDVAQHNLRRRPGPWDRRAPTVYVSGCEIICVPNSPAGRVEVRS